MTNTIAHDEQQANFARHNALEAGDAAPTFVKLRLSDVVAKEIEWLWHGRFAIGKVSMIVGDPGVGKSLLALDIAARVSSGQPWPDRPEENAQKADVLILSAEDEPADTLRPRLDALGADCNRISLLQSVRQRIKGMERHCAFDLSLDIEALRAELDANPHVRLIIIDPISAYLGRSDSHNNAEVRAALAPLCELAAKKHVAILCVTHLNKGAGSPMQRVIGSVAFAAVVRSAWLVHRDKNDPDVRLLLSIKNNLASDDVSSGLSYTIESRGEFNAPVVCWRETPVMTTAEEALSIEPAQRGRPAGRRRAAEEWLQTALADGPRPSTWLEREAQASGISISTLERAKKEIRVHSIRPLLNGPWYWHLPAQTLVLPSSGQASNAA